MTSHSDDTPETVTPDQRQSAIAGLEPPKVPVTAADAPKKGRGRPKGSRNRSRPEKVATPRAESSGRMTRDELATENASLKARLETLEKTPAVDISQEQLALSLASTFAMISRMAARMMRAPELTIDDDESRHLGEAWEPVARPYLLKHVDKLPLFGAVAATGLIFIPKFDAMIDRRRKEKQEKESVVAANVEARGSQA